MKRMIAMMTLAAVMASTAAFAEDVYVTKNGAKFHKESCPLIKNKGAAKIEKQDAVEKKLGPCKRCFKEVDNAKK